MSFVNDSSSVRHLKNYLSTKSSASTKVVAKMESLESLGKLEVIIEASDGIMAARDDLGVEIPLEHIPILQEEIVHLCGQLNKPVIVACQLLGSMVEYSTPTHAEVADVSKVVKQNANALMLFCESTIGLYGQKALHVLQMTSSRMESWGRVVIGVIKGSIDVGYLLKYKVGDNGKFTIITFEKYLSIALDTPRVVGVYLEIKNPMKYVVSIGPWKHVKDNYLQTPTNLVAQVLINGGVFVEHGGAAKTRKFVFDPNGGGGTFDINFFTIKNGVFGSFAPNDETHLKGEESYYKKIIMGPIKKTREDAKLEKSQIDEILIIG
ncbi:pyruvate kinase-like [Carya illinoinensis]|uniref:pyruvate kinase-like n=1 Tax=Carya illinoinensis TaxID=32201 RepID=UPI001C71CA4B|nr:pyruvate kinase-like [Carya illinoinensis]